MRAGNVIAHQAETLFLSILSSLASETEYYIEHTMSQWHITNSLYVKCCFGAINVENEIEIEKFFGTNIIKLLFHSQTAAIQ